MHPTFLREAFVRFDVLTLFPQMFNGPLSESILGRATQSNLVEVGLHNIRSFTTNKHNKVDDSPFGGGAGMVMMAEPIVRALEAVKQERPVARTILLSASGTQFNQDKARELAGLTGGTLVLICGRYEGVDARVGRHYCDEELSVGDYVLSGGELPAMVIIDAVSRLIPGVLGNAESSIEESQEGGVLEYPQYTRPREFEGHEVPAVLLDGDHKAIKNWRRRSALLRTKYCRPDLFSKLKLSPNDKKLLD